MTGTEYKMVTPLSVKDATWERLRSGEYDEAIGAVLKPWEKEAGTDSIVMMDVGSQEKQPGAAGVYNPSFTCILTGETLRADFKTFLLTTYGQLEMVEREVEGMTLLIVEGELLAKMKISALRKLVEDISAQKNQ